MEARLRRLLRNFVTEEPRDLAGWINDLFIPWYFRRPRRQVRWHFMLLFVWLTLCVIWPAEMQFVFTMLLVLVLHVIMEQ